ncbi:hypothetical protein [Streptomyces sp. NRRL B-1347]|uniref:hypothetical protein n=1 Tax=Streptomyces sp. NRRL B-1347 TaxID=1476877 RepID=UPI0004C8DA3C|nr:hypothetical protein [Streptomyces sp. NRRL B-1347]
MPYQQRIDRRRPGTVAPVVGADGRDPLVGDEVLAVPKSATEPSEHAAALDPARGRVAVSDGATRALASGPWAHCLVRRFVARPPDGFGAAALGDWDRAAAEEWAPCVRLSPQAPPYLWDALARWALTQAAHGPHAWHFLRRCDPGEFTTEVRALWRRGELEQDDVTLVRCRVDRVP